MITQDKGTEIFYIIDEFDKNLNVEQIKKLCLPSYNSNRKRCINRKGRLSESEIITSLVCNHFGIYRNFKEYYQNGIHGRFKHEFPASVSYNRFIELVPRLFFKMMLLMKLMLFGQIFTMKFSYKPLNYFASGFFLSQISQAFEQLSKTNKPLTTNHLPRTLHFLRVNNRPKA